MTDDEWRRGMERRLEIIEELAQHCTDPEDREIDRALRRTLKAAITFVWLVKHATLFAGAVIAAKLAYDQMVEWFR